MRVTRCITKFWWILLASAVVSFILATSSVITGTVFPCFKAYQSTDTHDFADLMISSAGWLLAFAVLLLTGKNALRALTFQALLKLHDDEGSPLQREAKRLVWKAKPPEGFSGNIYTYVREYVAGLPDEDRDRLDEARHTMTHF